MTKRTIVLVAAAGLLTGLTAVGYLAWNSRPNPQVKKELQSTEKDGRTVKSVSAGFLPSFGANPLQGKPDLNPADKANPFKSVRTNPFETR